MMLGQKIKNENKSSNSAFLKELFPFKEKKCICKKAGVTSLKMRRIKKQQSNKKSTTAKKSTKKLSKSRRRRRQQQASHIMCQQKMSTSGHRISTIKVVALLLSLLLRYCMLIEVASTAT
jgi:hypothetical protein